MLNYPSLYMEILISHHLCWLMSTRSFASKYQLGFHYNLNLFTLKLEELRAFVSANQSVDMEIDGLYNPKHPS